MEIRRQPRTAGLHSEQRSARELTAGPGLDRRSPVGTTFRIAPEAIESADARRLIAELDAGLAENYPPEQRFGPNLKPEQLAGGRGEFLVVREDGRAIGCGAIRVLDATTAEVKRMYVEPSHRGRGVGREVLAALETSARRLGVTRLVLETGTKQAAAIGLYRAAGYVEVDCWGEYASSPSSKCFAKSLA